MYITDILQFFSIFFRFFTFAVQLVSFAEKMIKNTEIDVIIRISMEKNSKRLKSDYIDWQAGLRVAETLLS